MGGHHYNECRPHQCLPWPTLAGCQCVLRQQHIQNPNIIFVGLIDWLVARYGITMTEDSDASQRRMAADWHPSDGFDSLMLRLFMGAAYGDVHCYPISDRDVIDIGIRVIQ